MERTWGGLVDANLEWIFADGRGCVGKTTSFCAIATLCAASTIEDSAPGGFRNRSVLLISADSAHNLSDAFKQRFGVQPTPVKGLETSLSAMEIDPVKFVHGSLLGLLTGTDGAAPATTALSPSSSSSATTTTAGCRAGMEELARQQSFFARFGGIIKEAVNNMFGVDELCL